MTEPTQVSGRGVEGPPTLVVEVLSSSTRNQDRTAKARRYVALGVPHYWLVDPEARRIECDRAEQGTYRLVCASEGDAPLSHPDWPALALTPADLWR